MNFIAIDFETANNNRISACAIGLAFVEDGTIVKSYKSYIRPPVSETFATTHTAIHGITKNDVINAKNFKELWDDGLRDELNDSLIVCHNASMDISVLCQLAGHYGLEGFKITHIDTMAIAKSEGLPPRLVDLVKNYNLEFSDNHDPEADAICCAEVCLAFDRRGIFVESFQQTSFAVKPSRGAFRSKALDFEEQKNQRKIIRSNRVKASELETFIVDGKAFLVTGEFSMDRDAIHDRIKLLGGTIKSGISSKLDYLIAGDSAGWSKINKVAEINSSGKGSIRILNEIDFFNALDDIENAQTG